MFRRFVLLSIHLFMWSFRFFSEYNTIFPQFAKWLITFLSLSQVQWYSEWYTKTFIHYLLETNQRTVSWTIQGLPAIWTILIFHIFVYINAYLISSSLKLEGFKLNNLHLFLLCMLGSVHLKSNNSDFNRSEIGKSTPLLWLPQ